MIKLVKVDLLKFEDVRFYDNSIDILCDKDMFKVGQYITTNWGEEYICESTSIATPDLDFYTFVKKEETK